VSVDEHMIELAGSPVFYRRAPGPRDPVLYLHGIPTSSDDWVPLLERTGGIAPDLTGFGRSGKGAHLDYSVEGHARFVEQFLGALGVERVRLVVHDWGAAGGLQFAERHPGRIERLIVCNAVPLLAGYSWPRFVRWCRRPGLGELLMGSVTRGVLARTLQKGGPWPEARIATIWEQFDQGTQRAILRLYRDADEPRLATLGEGLRALDLPALVVWGQRDPWLAPELAEAYAERLPRGRLEPIADAGHWPWLDHPAVVERMANFLVKQA
jgi:pimeloyl-ACP methyl ester carboxylesterase